MATRRQSAASVIAATFGWDTSDVTANRYHSTKTARPVYACGDNYYATGTTKPVELDLAWHPYSDQFFAQLAGTTMWEACDLEAA